MLPVFSYGNFALALENISGVEDYKEPLESKNEKEIDKVLLKFLICGGLTALVFIVGVFCFKKYVVRKYFKIKQEEYSRINKKYGGFIDCDKNIKLRAAQNALKSERKCGIYLPDSDVFIKRLQRLKEFIGEDIIEAMEESKNLGFFEAIEVNKKLNEWIQKKGEINGEKDNFSGELSEYEWHKLLEKRK